MTVIERAARALAEEEIRQHEARFAEGGWSASMSPDLEAADYIRAEIGGRYPERWAARLLRARAVLQAIREPSEGMVEAGEEVAMRPFVAAGQFTPETWQAMIDAALEEE
jgi:hypothetical protein